VPFFKILVITALVTPGHLVPSRCPFFNTCYYYIRGTWAPGHLFLKKNVKKGVKNNIYIYIELKPQVPRCPWTIGNPVPANIQELGHLGGHLEGTLKVPLIEL